MNVPITFPPVLARDLSEKALMVEAKVEGYLVRRIHIDEGASIEILFEHCFNMLHPSIRSRLVEMQTTVSGFLGEQVKPLGKIELDVCFGGSERCQRAIMKFIIIPSPSPYNIIIGRPGLKREGKKQAVEPPEYKETQDKAGLMEQVLVNPAYPEQLDYYPLPEIDSKIEAVMGFPLKCFLDAYKGYHQVKMAEEDEEKNCFLYIPRYVLLHQDAIWPQERGGNIPGQIRKGNVSGHSGNIRQPQKNQYEAKSKKCSFGVTEGKFLGYMVTSEGIRANPVKTKDIAEMQSPRAWGEMQSLAGKLAALNRFLSRSAEKSLPFFETLKDITKENKHDYRWTEKAKNAFQELKKMVLDLPALTTPLPKETLFVYLATSKEAVSAVLLVVRHGKQHQVHYVSRTLHDAERNYAPLEKMAPALRHVSRRLRRYFEAHPITVITDHPFKQILNKEDISGRLAQYSVELAAYNITYKPRSAIKG
ncbi:reverse transcriptase domain-containing protein [Tanacetum coccineum]